MGQKSRGDRAKNHFILAEVGQAGRLTGRGQWKAVGGQGWEAVHPRGQTKGPGVTPTWAQTPAV